MKTIWVPLTFQDINIGQRACGAWTIHADIFMQLLIPRDTPVGLNPQVEVFEVMSSVRF